MHNEVVARESAAVPVISSYSGTPPDVQTVLTTLDTGEAESLCAILIDTDRFSSDRIERGSLLILGKNKKGEFIEPGYAEEFYLESGCERGIATFIEEIESRKVYSVSCLAREDDIEIPIENVKLMAKIFEVLPPI